MLPGQLSISLPGRAAESYISYATGRKKTTQTIGNYSIAKTIEIAFQDKGNLRDYDFLPL